MKKINLLLAIGLMVGTTNLNAQTMKEKMQAKIDKANEKMAGAAKGKAKYTSYDYTDPSGVSGTYFTSVALVGNNQTMGFEFHKEKDGEIVNKLTVHGGKFDGKENYESYTLKEKYKTKFDINYFYNSNGALMQIADDIFAAASDGKVQTVLAKDSAKFNDFDIETAQVLYDQQMGKINTAAAEKETAIWMKNEVYKNNVDKIIFAVSDYHLCKRGYKNKPPMVDGKAFMTVLDMAKNMNYTAFFTVPPAVTHAGQDINVVYEMGGHSVGRVEYRKKSAAWGKMIPRIESNKYSYRQIAPRTLRAYESYVSNYVQDYAFIQLLYLNKGNFMIGKKYPLTVKMYANRDGENGDLLAEGTVSLLYSAEAHLMFDGDPSKPEKTPVWTQFEEFLDE